MTVETTGGTRYAHLAGGDHVLAAGVAARLRDDGLVVLDDLAALPAHAVLDMLIVDVTGAVPDVPDVPFRSVAEADLRALLDGQLHAFVAAVQAAVPRLPAGSAIVLIVPKEYLGSWGGVHVAATASACVAMARSMAIELAPRGIRVNSVATARAGDARDTADARAGIAAAVAWLAHADSGQITGETILADRGASLQMAQAARR